MLKIETTNRTRTGFVHRQAIETKKPLTEGPAKTTDLPNLRPKARTVDDWKADRNRLGLDGKSSSEILEMGGEAARFVDGFYKWVNKQPEDERDGLRADMFVREINSYRHLKTIEDWKAERDRLGLSGKSRFGMTEMGEKAAKFIRGFYRWARKQPEDERKTLRAEIFIRKKNSKYYHLKTIEGWKAERDRLGLSGKNLWEMKKIGVDAAVFVREYCAWVRKQPENKKEWAMAEIFVRNAKYGKLNSIEDWTTRRDELGLDGKSSSEMQDMGKKAAMFTNMFYSWVNKQPEDEREKLRVGMFVRKKK